MTDDAIMHELTYPHPVARVWAALTDAAALGRWLMPNDFAPRLGHRFTFTAPPRDGWSGIVACEVVLLDPPARLAYTWSDDPTLSPTLVTWTLTPVPGGTRLRLDHTGFAAGGVRGLSVRDLLAGGWHGLLHERLAALLDGHDGKEDTRPSAP